MKKPYKQHGLLKIKNINNSYKNKYKIRYSLFGIKYTVKNKAKLEFYKKYKEKKQLEKFNQKYKTVIDNLNAGRKNKNPVLTVILLTYNHADTIEKCIAGLLNQKTKYNYIIKICDDASTDGTTDICFEYAQKYPEKIEYILQPFNTKSRHFRNAIESIDTEYWCYIDGDDWWLKEDVIENAVSFLDENKEYSVYAANSLYVSYGRNQRKYIREFLKRKNNTYIALDNFVLPHPAGRIHRKVIDYGKEYTGMRLSDVYLFVTSLTKGKCYFKDEITNVRNDTKRGAFTKCSNSQKLYYIRKYWFALNTWTDFKYDKEISNIIQCKNISALKRIFGKKNGWKIFLCCSKYNYIWKDIYKDIKNISLMYKEIDQNQKIKQ